MLEIQNMSEYSKLKITQRWTLWILNYNDTEGIGAGAAPWLVQQYQCTCLGTSPTTVHTRALGWSGVPSG